MRWLPLFICLAWGPAEAHAAEPAGLLFERDVRPILKAHCFHCHGEEEEKQAGLDLRLVRWSLQGGDSGAAIVPGDSASSLLAQRVTAGEMPPGEKQLTPQEQATLLAWIDQGARTARPEPEALAAGADWTEEEREWWAFQPVRRGAPPAVRQPELVRTAVDAFLLARLEEAGQTFSPAADRSALIRRLAFDLTGLPPAPERAAAFVADPAPDAYERLVEELLASPAYGERWARHWLDVAGYADSDGYTETDPERPWAYRYRDYVIQAMNADKPWNEFVMEQLAGDELLSPPYENLSPRQAELLAATGFLRMAPDGTADGGVDAATARNDVMAETLKIVSSALLGLTVGCAQCHHHRYDPISQEDYYRFRAIFEPALNVQQWRPPAARLVSLWQPPQYAQAAAADGRLREIEQQRTEELNGIVAEIFEEELAKLEEGLRPEARAARGAAADQRTPQQQQILKDYPSLNVDGGSAYLYRPQRLQEFNAAYDQRMAEARAQRPAEDFVACLTEPADAPPPTYLFFRGDIQQPRQELPPADLSVLGAAACQIPAEDPALPTTGRRLALARGLTSGRHPLLGRVLVNRVWLHHFGRGLAASPADFGRLGELPSHPELLDWLADVFVASGWSLKQLHRLLVCSTAYRQASPRRPELEAIDPDNRLWGRMPVRRLEAEAIRDALLSVSGSLTVRLHGPAVTVFPDDVGQVLVGRGTRDGNGILQGDFALGPDLTRRSLYVQVRRSLPLSMLEPFDPPATAPNCELRTASTVAPQALLMMNNQFLLEQAAAFARRIESEAGVDPAAQVRRAWMLAYAREPRPEETAAAIRFLTEQQAILAADPAAETQTPPASGALALFCQALFCSNRFLYVD